MAQRRVMEIVTPLGDDVLLFHSMHGREELGRLSEFDVALLSKKADVNLDDILSKNVTVKLELPDRNTRHFNGFVTRFAQTGMHGRYHLYSARVSAWPWFLTRSANCRIFQELSVPEIIKKVFEEYSIADFKDELTASYTKRVYCVQYRETDFNFISRLMEEEGIYYFFRHKEGRHTMVLADSYSAHAPFAGYEQIPYIPMERTTRIDQECIKDWDFAREVQPGRYCLDDFDFEKPSSDLKVKTKNKRKYELCDYEIFDSPGEYLKSGDGEHYVRIRLDERQYQFELANAKSNARGVCVGSLFKLTGQQRNDQNREYLVLSADYELEYTEYEAMESQGAHYACGFTSLDSKQQFRPRRLTPCPYVQGPQTAVVVGPAGDEIYTDKYGRVKVQFHWDRYGKSDEHSSCWMRVAFPWAGKNWGMVAIPRIGQEVIVDFLEGDPDQPIITGRVYNAEQMPPWELPANKTQTGVLTRSSKGGSGANANAIRFEDKKGEEQLWIHAEKNQDIEVENDETHWVGHDRKKTIDNDETTHVKHDRVERVDNDESISIGRDRRMLIERDKAENVMRDKGIMVAGDHSEVIGASMSIMVASTLTESVGVNYAETVGGAMEITVGGVMAITVGAALAETVGGAKTESVGGSKSESIGGGLVVTVAKDVTESIGGNQTVTIQKNLSESIQGEQTVEVTKNASLKAKKIQLVADEEITFKAGSAEITMKKNGDITIKGNKITLKGDGDIILKGSKITEN